MKIINVLLSCFVISASFSSAASAVTVTESFPGRSHIDHMLPGYLVAGRIKILTTNNWESVSVGYSVSDQIFSRLTDLYIGVSGAVMTYGGDPYYEGSPQSRYIDRPVSGERFLTRWGSADRPGGHESVDLFGTAGFTVTVQQGMFGNEGWRVANIFINDRSETSVDLLLWDSALIDNVPPVPPVPLPASGFILLGAIGLLSLFRRRII